MSSKPKSKTYIVHQNGNFGEPPVIGRYIVGARNKDESEQLLRAKIGKHTKVRFYYEELAKDKQVAYGTVIKQC